MSSLSLPASVRAHGWGWRHAGRRAWAVADLDLDIEPGERVLLLGASGSGKSTVLAGLAGLLHGQDSGQDAGRLLVDSLPAHQARHRTGLLLQDPDSQLVMSRAGDDVAFGPENYAVEPEEIWRRVDEAMELVGFGYGRDRLTSALSGGEKQRLALAGVIANRPGLLLLDEPTANLDPDGALIVREAVRRTLERTSATFIVVEHRVADWIPMINRVVVVDGANGVIADGQPEEVFDAHARELDRIGVWHPRRSPGFRRTSKPPSTMAFTDAAARLRARQVSGRYRGQQVDAVVPTDFDLRAGTVTAVVGPNGSGKSTLAMLAAGLARPRTGCVVATDRSDRPLHRRRARSLARAVGTVLQNPEHQFLTSSVRGELHLAPRQVGWDAERTRARADELLEQLGLSALAEANPFTLSGGQKRRLSVATALSVAAGVLILDEPTFGQDATTWAELVKLLDAVRSEGSALMVVSHDREFVDEVADEVLDMHAGVLRRRGQ